MGTVLSIIIIAILVLMVKYITDIIKKTYKDIVNKKKSSYWQLIVIAISAIISLYVPASDIFNALQIDVLQISPVANYIISHIITAIFISGGSSKFYSFLVEKEELRKKIEEINNTNS